MRRVAINPSLAVGGALGGLILGAALLSLIWTPYDPAAVNIPARLAAPSGAYWFGTDHFGRDIFSMVLVGARNAMGVALAAVGIGLVLGLPLGVWAAIRRGWAEEGVMRLVDLAFAFPAILSAAVITANLGPGAATVILAVGLFNVAVFARVARGAALQVLGRPFVTAARAIGRTEIQVVARHLLPNMAAVLVVQATVQIAVAILAEAALSYIGFGLQPPDPSWGRMLAESQTRMAQAPHVALLPGAAIALAVLGFNLLGDGLRDALDPRLKPLRLG